MRAGRCGGHGVGGVVRRWAFCGPVGWRRKFCESGEALFGNGTTDMKQTDEFWHFVDAQAPVYSQVLRELAAGCKYSHWMWFIFPQLSGLGHSSMSQRYAIDSLDQAQRYLAHSVLGRRLIECTTVVLHVQGKTADDIFRGVDTLKFHSSMTLFSLCDHSDTPFAGALTKYFGGRADVDTLRLLGTDTAQSQKGAR
jgi:uncharacterized protein (DUF1810 family)